MQHPVTTLIHIKKSYLGPNNYNKYNNKYTKHNRRERINMDREPIHRIGSLKFTVAMKYL